MRPTDSHALAEVLNASHHGPVTKVFGVATLEDAEAGDVSFGSNTKAKVSRAGVLITTTPIPGRCCLCVADPKYSFILLLNELFPVEHRPGIAESAQIDPSAVVHETATIHPGVVVMRGCKIGANSVLFPKVVLYPNTEVGAWCRIHAGAVIGADGFAFHPTETGLVKVPQLGRVVIEDQVEIGANSTIDRAFLGETRVGKGTKLDNLVHIGHNCQLGEAVIVAAQVGLSGSVRVGDRVMIGGQAGVAEHIQLGEGAQVGAQSGVTKSVSAGVAVLGTPAENAMKMKRIYAQTRMDIEPKG